MVNLSRDVIGVTEAMSSKKKRDQDTPLGGGRVGTEIVGVNVGTSGFSVN